MKNEQLLLTQAEKDWYAGLRRPRVLLSNRRGNGYAMGVVGQLGKLVDKSSPAAARGEIYMHVTQPGVERVQEVLDRLMAGL